MTSPSGLEIRGRLDGPLVDLGDVDFVSRANFINMMTMKSLAKKHRKLKARLFLQSFFSVSTFASLTIEPEQDPEESPPRN